MLPMNLIFPTFTIFISLISVISLMNFWTFLKMKKSKCINSPKFYKLKNKILGLFISFDPHSSLSILTMKELNWAVSIFMCCLYFYSFWVLPNRLSWVKKSFLNNLGNQFSIALKTNLDGSKSFFNSLFVFFLFCNLLGLIPNLFTPTSHITFNLLISIPFWIGFILFGWFTYTNKMLAHLVPLGTPKALISFMIVIESISTLIRPMTLGIRLMANMVSGHLLLTLMGNSMSVSPFFILLFLIFVQTLLSMLEIGVSMIQAYVFCMLLTLYSDDSDFSKEH